VGRIFTVAFLVKNVACIGYLFVCRLGSPDFTDPPAVPTPENGSSCSLFFPDEAIFQGHPRFKTLTRNIRQRRGSKVAINLPSELNFILKEYFSSSLKFFSTSVIH